MMAMGAAQYSIGLDFGTLSVRALLVDVCTGQEMGNTAVPYSCGVITGALPDGTPIPDTYALADPFAYLESMQRAVGMLLSQTGVSKEQIIGLGLDATASSPLPVDENAMPLLRRYPSNPHAYLKLWKHHGAQAQADALKRAAINKHEPWIAFYGNGILCEYLLPKALETAQKAPEVWRECACYAELGDWLVWQLTGRATRSVQVAGCCGYYRQKTGYPGEAFQREAAPDVEPVTRKFMGTMCSLGEKAGELTEDMAARLGLLPGISVASALLDSHASALGCGATAPGDITAVLGTSGCWMLNSDREMAVPGVSTSSYEKLTPGMYGYEVGQSSFGDALDWFVRTCMPARLEREAEACQMEPLELLSRKASHIPMGSGGVLALDWLNGNRSPGLGAAAQGAFAGLTLHTTLEQMYRAMMEALCCGARREMEHYKKAKLPMGRIFAVGGIPKKNPVLMQILADILKQDILVMRSAQTGALGSAIMAAAASGRVGSVEACISRMATTVELVYHPGENAGAADAVYGAYCLLAQRFETKY